MRAANMRFVISGQAVVGDWKQADGFPTMWREMDGTFPQCVSERDLAFTKAGARDVIKSKISRKRRSLQKQLCDLDSKEKSALSAIESSDLPEGGTE